MNYPVRYTTVHTSVSRLPRDHCASVPRVITNLPTNDVRISMNARRTAYVTRSARTWTDRTSAIVITNIQYRTISVHVKPRVSLLIL